MPRKAPRPFTVTKRFGYARTLGFRNFQKFVVPKTSPLAEQSFAVILSQTGAQVGDILVIDGVEMELL